MIKFNRKYKYKQMILVTFCFFPIYSPLCYMCDGSWGSWQGLWLYNVARRDNWWLSLVCCSSGNKETLDGNLRLNLWQGVCREKTRRHAYKGGICVFQGWTTNFACVAGINEGKERVYSLAIHVGHVIMWMYSHDWQL